MALFSLSANAVTFEEYIVDHESDEMRAYLTGYADAVHNNAYFIGGCPRKLPYRPYWEYFQHIDIYISKKTKDKSTDLNAFYQEPVEPLLTAVILKYINCNNPEARYLKNEPKRIQIEMRNLARNIMNETQKFQTPEEREKEFAYTQHIDRLNNPKKYEVKCPACPKPQKYTQPKKEVAPKPKPIPVPAPVASPPQPQPTMEQPIKKEAEPHKNEHWYSRVHLLEKKEVKVEEKAVEVKKIDETPKI